MEDLLLLVHRFPYPPNKGDKIRSHALLRHLARRYRVHLAAFVDDASDWQHLSAIQALCASSHFARLDPFAARLRCLGALMTGGPLSFAYYRDAGMQAWVDMTMRAHAIRKVVAFSSPMAQYAARFRQAHRVIDFCDIDSDKWRQYAAQKHWPASLLFHYEARSLLAAERAIAAAWNASLFVSSSEARLFRKLAPECSERVGHFNLGVDTDYFSPAGTHANPYPAGEEAIVFTGAMDYWPNIDAVQWFASHVLPRLLATGLAVRFYIVGMRPTCAVLKLARLAHVTVTGAVADVRPYLQHAAAAVAPLRVARGVQNKVLEAMAMGRTVVVSPQAMDGIDAAPGIELMVADGAREFAARLADLLQAPDPAMGEAARARIENHYSWPGNLAAFDARLECV